MHVTPYQITKTFFGSLRRLFAAPLIALLVAGCSIPKVYIDGSGSDVGEFSCLKTLNTGFLTLSNDYLPSGYERYRNSLDVDSFSIRIAMHRSDMGWDVYSELPAGTMLSVHRMVETNDFGNGHNLLIYGSVKESPSILFRIKGAIDSWEKNYGSYREYINANFVSCD